MGKNPFLLSHYELHDTVNPHGLRALVLLEIQSARGGKHDDSGAICRKSSASAFLVSEGPVATSSKCWQAQHIVDSICPSTLVLSHHDFTTP